MEYIVLEIADVELEVVPMHELPGLKVLRVLSMPADMQRLKMSVDLLRLALRNAEDWNGVVKYLTMGELIKVIDQWMEKSQEESNRQSEEEEYYNDLVREEQEFEDDLDFEQKAMEDYEDIDSEYEVPELTPEILYDAFVEYLSEYKDPTEIISPEEYDEGEESE
jgi:hypothetical protein